VRCQAVTCRRHAAILAVGGRGDGDAVFPPGRGCAVSAARHGSRTRRQICTSGRSKSNQRKKIQRSRNSSLHTVICARIESQLKADTYLSTHIAVTMHPVQATAPRFVRLLLNASRSAASNSACISSSTHASSSSSFSHISNHKRTLFTTKHSAMSAAGHGTIERRFEKHGPVRGTPAPSPHSLDLDQHRVDRPDIKASYIDTHCHMFTTLSLMKAVCSFPHSTTRIQQKSADNPRNSGTNPSPKTGWICLQGACFRPM
jgi:hypothetical protein